MISSLVSRGLCRAGALLCLVNFAKAAPELTWNRLAPLPDAEGFAGMYAGESGGTLLAAGGTQFTNGVPWWQGGKKIWSDAIYALDLKTGTWRILSEKLPRLLGDGVSFTHGGRLICVAGGDETRAYADVFALQMRNGRVETTSLPALPRPTLKLGGTVIGDWAYVVGGRTDPNSPTATRAGWALDLSRPAAEQRWVSIPDCPGPGRMMPIVVAAKGAFYVFGGIEIRPDDAGKAKNVAPYLRDAWRFIPGARDRPGKWEALADMPQPLAGSPSPAWLVDPDTILIFGGVDGAIEAIADRSSIRALPGQILAYHIAKNQWTRQGEMPSAEIRVNAPAVSWRSGYAIISGEYLPARRTNACTLVTAAPAR